MGACYMFVYLMMIDTIEDQSKFEQLYLEYKGLMFYVAYNILHHEQDAEDAVHHAFVKIAENIDKIHDIKCPKTRSYIVTIVESKAIDQYRMNQRRGNIEYWDEVDLCSIQANENEVLGLSDCILKLPLKYRQVIILKYYHGFNNKEIAKQLSISEANAAKLDQRAKAKLRKICEEEGIL